jgi:hypothetical protein
MQWEGLSDLTTSEGNVKNFSRICALFSKKTIYQKNLLEIIKNNKEINRTNEKVIERHLSIMEKLGIISHDKQYYYLEPYGKILYEFINNKGLSDSKLIESELYFYFKVFFTGKALPQLYLLLDSLSYENKNINETIYNYYKNILNNHLKIWDYININMRLDEYKNFGTLRKAEKNRFDCMKIWLINLKMINKNELTHSGKKIYFKIKELRKEDNWNMFKNAINNNIFYFCTLFNQNKIYEIFNIDNHKETFIKYLKETYYTFGNSNTKTLDSIYIENWPHFNLLIKNNIYFKNNMDIIIDYLFKENIIKSIIPGDYYKQKILQINECNL